MFISRMALTEEGKLTPRNAPISLSAVTEGARIVTVCACVQLQLSALHVDSSVTFSLEYYTVIRSVTPSGALSCRAINRPAPHQSQSAILTTFLVPHPYLPPPPTHHPCLPPLSSLPSLLPHCHPHHPPSFPNTAVTTLLTPPRLYAIAVPPQTCLLHPFRCGVRAV